jgi:hypothetical protein
MPGRELSPNSGVDQTIALPDSSALGALSFLCPVKPISTSNRSKTMIFYIIGVVVVIAVVASYLGLHF